MLFLLRLRIVDHLAAVFTFLLRLIFEELNAVSAFGAVNFEDIFRFEIIRILSRAFVHDTPHWMTICLYVSAHNWPGQQYTPTGWHSQAGCRSPEWK